jgi:predicted ABC-type transport system involved in lysophospholipase L1 biosynthesis ATPase subunit
MTEVLELTDVLVAAHHAAVVLGQGDARTEVFRHASFSIRAGDRIGIAGPSGSGKSTLLHLVAGIVEPTSGTVEWPLLAPGSTLRPTYVSIAFQGPSLMAPLSLLENVSLPLLLAGSGEREATEHATAMLDRFGLLELADRLPEELSGGQSQRGGVARALVGRPRLIVADEPTGQSDQASGARVIDVLLEVAAAAGSALLVATHDRRVAGRMDRQWTIRDHSLETGSK